MQPISYCCRSFLPSEQELVTFFVDDREASVFGKFADGKFHSRWADYDVGRVQSWQAAVAGADPMREQAVESTMTERLDRSSILGRLSNCLRSRAADRDVVPT